MDFAVG